MFVFETVIPLGEDDFLCFSLYFNFKTFIIQLSSEYILISILTFFKL